MNKSAIKKEIIRTEVREAGGIEYRYTLTLSEGLRVSSYGIPLYSISVEMNPSIDGRASEYTAENLFSDSKKAFAFFDKIVGHLATPIDLPYVVEDELSSYEKAIK